MKTYAQSETYLLPFNNKVAINPSLAGLNNNDSYHSGNQYYYVNEGQTYNLLYASWDSYSDKLKGGIALTFGQGLINELNVCTTEFGFSYSGFPIKTKNGEILLSVGTNLLVGTKQWTVAFLDGILLGRNDLSSPPGDSFFRYTTIKPKLGFLWTNDSFQFGITGATPYRLMAPEEFEYDHQPGPVSITIYMSGVLDKRKKDLYSKPFQLSPELIVFYNEESILSRLSMLSSHTDKTWGFFVQDDFTNNIHTLGGTIGYKRNFVRINLNAGMAIPGISDENSFLCELSLNIVVPPFDYSKINPWAPAKN
ncbi:hypothetical protein SLH46_08590 [Draconibacterium sp. IB214405]|uniref:hypothetical protein n=1 Tax=Draconibacterium sp. IB214405 TaxID=3097352 RepID=UPI002A12143D|nr:hypothetical protein [Draconibacterium sp. IB214405]MDX8339234.1 hypothetical protein [Draconibacterium sp. IB214405]